MFATQDLRTKSRNAQSQIIDLDQPDRPILPTLATDGGTAVHRSTAHGLEFRQSACEDGKKLAVEVWSATGVRLARRVIDGVGPKPLSPGVFGRPSFSPSGHKVAFVAERTPDGSSAAGYWGAEKKEGDKGEKEAEAPASAAKKP